MSEGAASSTRELGTDGARCLATDHSAAAKSPVKTTASHLVSAQPIPTKESIEAEGGVFHGIFNWPISDADDARFWGFKHGRDYPLDHLRHDCHVGNKVIVFSLYCGEWTRKSSEPESPVVSGEYETVATSKPKYSAKQQRKRNKKRETA